MKFNIIKSKKQLSETKNLQKMKKTIYTCCFRPALLKAILLAMLVVVGVRGGTQSWNWANSAGGYAPDYPCEVAVDNNNNIYVGLTSLSDPCIFNSNSFSLNGFCDFFVVKYDSQGNEIWIKQCGGPYVPIGGDAGKDAIVALRYDPISNSLYLYGSFVGSCNFGELTIGASSYDDRDVFLAKFDLEGNCIWAKRIGSTSSSEYWDRAFSMSVDNEGLIHICAFLPFNGSIGNLPADFGGNLAKFDSEGNCLYVKKIFTIPYPGELPPMFFLNSNINNEYHYLMGYNIVPDFTVDTISMSVAVYSSQLIGSFDLNGNIQWMKAIGGPSRSSLLTEIGSDNQGNIYIPGSFTGSFATFGSDTIFSESENGIFLAKYSKFGELIWVKHADASLSAHAYSANIGINDCLYLAGNMNGTIDFDNFHLTSYSSHDLFILKYDQEGNILGGDNTNAGTIYYLRVDQNNSINICGAFTETANFGNIILQEQGPTLGDVFVAQHTPISHVGVTENLPTSHNDLLIYANPSTGICNISIPEELQHEENLTLLVYDNAGKLILQQEINMQEEKISLNLQAEAKGIYNAILTNGKQKFQGRVVVE